MMREKLARYGQWTYRGAWAIELVAAALGLTTGIALGWQGYVSSETSTAFDFVMQSAPFFMVALAELTKIPIATLLFVAPYRYKPILAIFLFGLAFITFETVFTGLERAAALRQLKYEELHDGLRLRQQELARLENEVRTLNEIDETAKAQQQYEVLNAQWISARKNVLDELERVDNEQTIPPSLRTEMSQTRGRLEEERNALEAVYKRRDAELSREQEAFESQRKSYVDRISAARTSGDLDYAKQQQQELAALRNPGAKVYGRYQPDVQVKQETITTLTKKLNDLSGQIPSSDNPAIQQRRELLNDNLRKLDEDWQRRLEDARSQLATAQQREANKSEFLANRRARIDDLNSQINEQERERVPMARTDQVRRIAARFYGKNPENVTGDQADLVAVIWFGSLALLAALTGPLTAMVALGLQRIADGPESKQESKLARALRRLIVKWRFKRTKTVKVDVPVEVPVEKIVEKEVPVEKVVKEILYVPILTDDPEALKKALSADIPKDVADFVSVKMAGDQTSDQPSKKRPRKRTK